MAKPAALGMLCSTLILAGCDVRAPEPAHGPSAPAATATAGATPLPGRTPAPLVPRRLQALGTEPFWSVEIDGAALRYSTPDDIDGRSFSAARRDGEAASTWTGELDDRRFELVVAPGPCSDGMSDTEYPFSAVLTLADQTNPGCARPPR